MTMNGFFSAFNDLARFTGAREAYEIGTGLVSVGIIADLISVNRRLLEDIDLRLQRLDDRLPKSNKGGLDPESHE